MPDPETRIAPLLKERTPWAENHFLKSPAQLTKRIEALAPAPRLIVDLGCGLGLKSLGSLRKAWVTSMPITCASG
ncbi:MAG: hypothetical protein RIG84_12885 [Roseovarius sp.]